MARDAADRAEAATGTPGRTAGARLRSLLTVYLKGMAMGAADTVPGVSGGTIALITGVYERFVAALTALDPSVLARLGGVHTADGRRALAGDLRRMDVPFLAALGLGVVTAVVTLSRVVHLALVEARAGTFAFFFGLIAASAVVLADAVSLDTPGRAGAAVAGFVFAFLLTGASAGGAVGHGLAVVFLSGAVGVTAMVLPGVSGSFVLLVLGQYEYLTGTLSTFVDGLVGTLTGASAPVLRPGVVVGTGVAGGVVGLLTVAHVIQRALRAYRAATLAFLVSLMAGSLRLPVTEVRGGVDAWTPAVAGGIAAAAVVGAGAVLLLDRYTDDLSY